MLFNDSIGYNIAYGREGASAAELRRRPRAPRSTASSRFCRKAMPRSRRTRAETVGGENSVSRLRAPCQEPAGADLDERTRAPTAALRRRSERWNACRAAHDLVSRTAFDGDRADRIIVLDRAASPKRGPTPAARDARLYADMWQGQQAEKEEGTV